MLQRHREGPARDSGFFFAIMLLLCLTASGASPVRADAPCCIYDGSMIALPDVTVTMYALQCCCPSSEVDPNDPNPTEPTFDAKLMSFRRGSMSPTSGGISSGFDAERTNKTAKRRRSTISGLIVEQLSSTSISGTARWNSPVCASAAKKEIIATLNQPM